MLALVAASPAGAVTLVTPEGDVAQPYQRWADRAKAPTPEATVVINPDASRCPLGRTACTGPGLPVYFEPDGDRHEDRTTVLHELGHHFDYLVMDDHARTRFGWFVGPGIWRTGNGDSTHERFAEAWSICARIGNPRRPRMVRRRINRIRYSDGFGYGYEPTWRIHRRACALMDRVYARNG